QGAATLLCRSSADALAKAAGREQIDTRRFRMTIELDGFAPFAEDDWIGRELRIGAARLRPFGHVGRCTVTTLDPDSGEVDRPTPRRRGGVGGAGETTERLGIGVQGAGIGPGDVAVGAPVGVGGGRRCESPYRRTK